MNNVKKQFVELVNFLELNKSKKVSDIMDQLSTFVESKKKDSTYILDKNGKPFAIFCYYHKQWELVKDVKYGSKKGTKTGLNTMCKIGTSHWTKAQSLSKKAKEQLLIDVANGKVEAKNLMEEMDKIEVNRTTISKENMPIGTQKEPTI